MSAYSRQGSSPSVAKPSKVREVTTQSADKDQKPNIYSDPQFINLKIYYEQDGSVTDYRAIRNTKLLKLLIAFFNHGALDMKFFEILYEGRELKIEKTPLEILVEMEDGDVIDVMLHGTGGSMMV